MTFKRGTVLNVDIQRKLKYESTSNNTRSVGGGGVEVTHGALFNGIGGFQLAAAWCGWENVFSVEIDKWCNKVTAQHFPNCKQYENIYDFDGKEYEGRIDIISGGFPCQPFSVAGKRKGAEDDRHLWPEMLRVISEVKPSWVVAENVSGLLTISGGLVFEQVLSDLENAGYEVQPYIVPACATNAPHRRDRLWIVANSSRETVAERTNERTINSGERTEVRSVDSSEDCIPTSDSSSNGRQRRRSDSRHGHILPDIGRVDSQGDETWSGRNGGIITDDSNATNTKRKRLERRECEAGQGQRGLADRVQHGEIQRAWDEDWSTVAAALCRVDDGLPRQVDRAKRLKALGNAIVPQVAFELFNGIHLLETNKENN